MTDTTAHPFRPARYRGHGITDLDRAKPRQVIPLADLKPLFDAWNEAQDRAKAAYYGTTKYYAARTAKSEASQRYRARKKAS